MRNGQLRELCGFVVERGTRGVPGSWVYSRFLKNVMKQREGIKAIAMDMWDPYLASIREYVPRAEEKIAFDRYHLMTHMGKVVDTVRKREHGVLKKAGDETLKGSKHLWLYTKENLPEKYQEWFCSLKEKNLKTTRLS